MERRALIIDDDVFCLDISAEYFQDKGFSTVAKIRATCPMLEQGATTCPMTEPCYDIILSDNRMPEMTGLDFFIHQGSCGCKLPPQHKTLISGDISVEDAAIATSLGYKIFNKPCSLETLDQWVDALITVN